MKFAIATKTIPIELEHPDGRQETLEMREMTAAIRDRYLGLQGERAKHNTEGVVVGIKNFDGIHSDLLCLCLYRDGTPVPKSEVQGWPASMTSALYAEAQKLNMLNQPAKEVKEEAKKD